MIKADYEKDIAIIKVCEAELNMYIVPEIRELILKEHLKMSPKAVILDLQDVYWMDSSAIGLLFFLRNTILQYGGTFILANMTERNLQMLKGIRALQLFSHYDSLASALGSVSQTAA